MVLAAAQQSAEELFQRGPRPFWENDLVARPPLLRRDPEDRGFEEVGIVLGGLRCAAVLVRGNDVHLGVFGVAVEQRAQGVVDAEEAVLRGLFLVVAVF